MKNLLPLLVCSLAFNFVAHAGYTPIALTPNSYNQDAVVENTAPVPLQALVTANMDAGTNITGLFGGSGTNHASFTEVGAVGNASCGLPMHGSTFIAASDTNHTFQMAPDYTTNNAIFVGGSQGTLTQVPTGTFTLTNPAAFKKLSILNAAGSGPATVTYTVHFQGGATEQATFTAFDWVSTNAPDTNSTAFLVNGYFQGTDASIKNVNVTPKSVRLFYNDLTLANSNGLVTSVDFTYTVNNSRVAIFGLSGSTNGTNFTPVAVTGFNQDMIIEAFLPYTVTATPDGGTNTYNTTAWYEQGFVQSPPAPVALSLTGLPHPGASFTALSNANVTFKMPSSYLSNNAVLMDSSITSAALIPDTYASYKKLAVLTSANTPAVLNYLIIHTDFTVESGTFTNQNWMSSSVTNVAFIAGGRSYMLGNTIFDALTTNGTKLYYFFLNVTNPAPVARIQFTQNSARSWIFALSGDATGSDVFSPISITGFNTDMVVEQAAHNGMNSRDFTSVTPSVGTNNGNLSFYEKGFNPIAANSGLPLANSVVSSTNQPDRQYRMAPSYSLPNVVYLETNSPVADITFATPTNYSALSFLTTSANGQVQAQVVVHYAGGAPSITNVLTIKDWFNPASSAYSLSGLVNNDNRGAVTWVPGTSSARLYDAQVPLPNLSNNITGVTLRWTTNNGSGGLSSASSHLFFFAVSGVIPGEPAISLQPTNSALSFGSNGVLTVNVSGAFPFTFQWQSAVTGSGVFTNIVDGGNISGANSTNLTFNSATYANNADYRLVVVNGSGSITSSVVKVLVLLPLPNILSPADAIQPYNGISGFASEGVSNAINGTMAKYLRADANGAPPFVGPVGLIVTPAVGETRVNGIRLFTANDHQERDPIDFEVDGSNDGGSNWTYIASNPIALPDTRNTNSSALANPVTQAFAETGFVNAAAYSTYRVFFRNVKTNATANSMQIGEIQLLGAPTTNPPVFKTDLPSMQLVNIGDTLVLTTKATGGGSITYSWKRNGLDLTNNAKISGAQSNVLSITSVDAGDIGNFQAFATNAYGLAASTVDAISVLPATEFNTNGLGWRMNGSVNGSSSPATIVSNVLSLTAGSQTGRSAFLTNRVNITGFLATYTYQNASAGGADGVAFILQNDPRGTTALGALGGSLGASDIKPGLSVQFNIYSGSVIGMAINTNGVVGNFQSTSPVSLISGHPIDVSVLYSTGLLQVTLSDATAGVSFKTNLTVNVPSVVGGDAAFVGFSGASGGVGSTQTISNFQFTPLPILTAKWNTNTAQFSWPAAAGYLLQSTTNLGVTSWTTDSSSLSLTNATFQLNTGTDKGRKFYRLIISNP
jgi:hypothetical protein